MFDRAGREITVEEFDRLLGDPDVRRVASTEVGPYWVSTVWLGLDHRFRGDGPPLIFETMVFAGGEADADMSGLDTRRWSTEEEARRGHEEIVLLVEATTSEVRRENNP
jgi:hypothetical protein